MLDETLKECLSYLRDHPTSLIGVETRSKKRVPEPLMDVLGEEASVWFHLLRAMDARGLVNFACTSKKNMRIFLVYIALWIPGNSKEEEEGGYKRRSLPMGIRGNEPDQAIEFFQGPTPSSVCMTALHVHASWEEDGFGGPLYRTDPGYTPGPGALFYFLDFHYLDLSLPVLQLVPLFRLFLDPRALFNHVSYHDSLFVHMVDMTTFAVALCHRMVVIREGRLHDLTVTTSALHMYPVYVQAEPPLVSYIWIKDADYMWDPEGFIQPDLKRPGNGARLVIHSWDPTTEEWEETNVAVFKEEAFHRLSPLCLRYDPPRRLLWSMWGSEETLMMHVYYLENNEAGHGQKMLIHRLKNKPRGIHRSLRGYDFFESEDGSHYREGFIIDQRFWIRIHKEEEIEWLKSMSGNPDARTFATRPSRSRVTHLLTVDMKSDLAKAHDEEWLFQKLRIVDPSMDLYPACTYEEEEWASTGTLTLWRTNEMGFIPLNRIPLPDAETLEGAFVATNGSMVRWRRPDEVVVDTPLLSVLDALLFEVVFALEDLDHSLGFMRGYPPYGILWKELSTLVPRVKTVMEEVWPQGRPSRPVS